MIVVELPYVTLAVIQEHKITVMVESITGRGRGVQEGAMAEVEGYGLRR